MGFPFPGGDPGDPGYWEVIFDVIPFPVYVADYANHQIICANRAMRQRVGCRPGEKCHQAIYQQDQPCLFCKMGELEVKGEAADNHVVFEHFNDLDDCWYQLRETMVTWFDGRRAKYSIAVDISALKDVQNALSEAHAELAMKNRDLNTAVIKAREAERAKSEFLAVMSHEIRTPMNSILGMVRLLADRPLEAEDHEKVEIIRESGDALLAIINDILDFSRLEAGGISFETQPFEPTRVVGGVVSLMGAKAQEKGLSLSLDMAAGLPGWVAGDAARLRQVLINLIGNAIKFTETGGIVLGARPADFGPAGIGIEFSVSDSGIGMAPEQLERLFHPFSQADASISRRFGGSGLGLAICKRLVEAQGGAIGVDSAPGQGSRFWFRLPLAATQAPPPAIRRDRIRRLPPLKILLAEDNLFNQRVALGILGKEGHRVSVVANGAEAVEAVRREHFDLVLMDMQMPDVDGPEATRRIRALPGAVARIPIVALTANALPADAKRCLDAGMDAHVSKPIDPVELSGALASVLSAFRDGEDDSLSLDGIASQLGSVVAADLARTFLDSGDEVCQRIAAAFSGGDLDAVAKAAHELQGLAAYSGTDSLGALAARITRTARAGDGGGLAGLVVRLQSEWSALRLSLAAKFELVD